MGLWRRKWIGLDWIEEEGKGDEVKREGIC